MKIVFMGTPALAAHILERLIAAGGEKFEIVGVVTQPDRPRKRGLKFEQSEVAAVAERHGLMTFKPAKIRTPAFAAELKKLEPDLLVVAAYGRILPTSLLEAARIMPLNVHASLLPRYRGAAPIEAAILAGDEKTGVTIMRMSERMDAGAILLQREIAIAPDDTQDSLKDKLADLGADTLIEALDLLSRGELNETPQDEKLATYVSPIAKEDAVIDWRKSATEIERMTRAYHSWPIARTNFNGEDLMIYRARCLADDPATDTTLAGTIVALKPSVLVKCGAGLLEVQEVQAPGRKRMTAMDFMRGRRVEVGARLGA